jgi:hypothetical protein
MEPTKYATGAAFRRALEDRLQAIASKEGVDLQRLRRQVAFDRLLARLFELISQSFDRLSLGSHVLRRLRPTPETRDYDNGTVVFQSGKGHTKILPEAVQTRSDLEG